MLELQGFSLEIGARLRSPELRACRLIASLAKGRPGTETFNLSTPSPLQ